MSIYEVRLDREAERDLRRMGPGPERERVRTALKRLADNDPSADVKAVRGSPGWLRFRVGDTRVLYYFVPPDRRIILVGRIVPRGELDRAVAGLPKL